MKPPFRALLVFLVLVTLSLIWLVSRSDPTPAPPEAPRKNTPLLAELGKKPDWSRLDRFQETISWSVFLDRLESVYSSDGTWRDWISIDPGEKQATIGNFTLRFSERDRLAPGSSYQWKRRVDLDPARALPLSGLKIALDPGHIGGAYAALEEREYRWGDTVIREGTMTLATAKILAPMLEKLGASVTLVRSKLAPVTGKRAEDFADPRLFYRTAEIRERARLVNDLIQPDLVICLHYNGSASKIPELSQHFHLILNGTYTREELSHEDERFEMLQRLLSGTITEELPLARQIADAFNEIVNLPAYDYPANSLTSQRVGNHPNLWARNLLANRLYQCPVIFLEPYVMNSLPFIARYRESPDEIYREYARAVAEGLVRYYSQP